MNKNIKYFNKIKKEFEGKGWDFSKVLGRSNPFNIVKNNQSMERFKKRVAKERAYNKEREKIEKEYKKIWSRIKTQGVKYKNNKTKNIRQQLKSQGYSKRSINKILDLQKEFNLSDNQILNKSKINDTMGKKMIYSLINEIEVTKGGENKKIKGAFTRFSGIPRIKERLDRLQEMVRNDEQALHHSEHILQRFLDETLLQRYEEFRQKHGRYITPPEKFYVGLVDDLLSMYSKYVE